MSEPSGTTSPVIDVNMLRRTAIEAHGLIHADRAYWLYYDETNNIRRLHLQADAFNVPDLNCWVLGGLGRRDSTPIDVAPLRARAGALACTRGLAGAIDEAAAAAALG